MFDFSTDLHTTPEKALDRARVMFAYGRVEVTGTSRNELALTRPRPSFSGESNVLGLIKTGQLTIDAGRIALKAELRTVMPKMLSFSIGPILLLIPAFIYLTGSYKEIAEVIVPFIIGIFFSFLMPLVAAWANRRIEADIRRAITSIAME